MKFSDGSAPKPFVYFAKACSDIADAEISAMRTRLARELTGIVGYMAKCDLESNNEPAIILFTRLEPEVRLLYTHVSGRASMHQTS